jgi:hypothetical protein
MRRACLYECSYEATCHLNGMTTVGALRLPSIVCLYVSVQLYVCCVWPCRQHSCTPHASTVESSCFARAALTVYRERIQFAQKCTHASYSEHKRPPQVARLLGYFTSCTELRAHYWELGRALFRLNVIHFLTYPFLRFSFMLFFRTFLGVPTYLLFSGFSPKRHESFS